MEVYFENLEGKILCFNHAVKAVIEKDEKIRAEAPAVSHSDMGASCCECFPPEEEIIEEPEDD